MLAHAPLVAYVATTDLARAKAFYEGTLGLTCQAERPSHLMFQAGTGLIQVLKVGTVEAPSYGSVGWNVTDLAATIKGLAAKGLKFERYEGFEQDELGIWVAPSGSRVAWAKDPEGHTLVFTQLA